MLAKQVEQCGLYCRHGMDRDAQVERLKAATARVSVGERIANFLQYCQVLANGTPDEQVSCVLYGLSNLLAARHFGNPCVASTIGKDRDVPCEERTVGSTEVQQHAVATCNGDNA